MGTKREEVKERLTSQILEAALSEFAEKGYAAATLRSIAARAGVSNGVITKYFETKEGLLMTLLTRNTLEGIFEGLESSEPGDILNCYVDFVKNLLINRTVVFRFYYMMFNDTQLTGAPDGIVTVYLWEEFKGSTLEKAIVTAQEEGDIPNGEPLQIYRLLVHMTFEILEQYSSIGLSIPENSFILNTIQYNPGEKNRRKFIEEKEREIRGLSSDLRLMAQTVERLFPLSIYCNLTKNKYHMLDYDDFHAHKAEYSGTYDELIAVGMSTVDDKADRESFRRAFNRQALLDSFENGNDVVGLIHRQTGDDGKVRLVYTRALMSKDENGDVLSIGVAYELPDYLQQKDEYRQEIQKFNIKAGRG